MQDIAIAHKDFDVRGGGEVLVERLAEMFDAPLYVGRRDPAKERDDSTVDVNEIPLSRLDKWLIDRGGVARAVAYMFGWQYAAEELAEYDTVVTSGNEPMWYVPPDTQTIVAYTHSTPRFMYDLYPHQVPDQGRASVLFNTAQRTAYQHNTARPDLWVCNSDVVARRVQRYHHVNPEDVRVVYPPVDTHHYNPRDAATEDFYLHLGRLADHKRVDGIVEAFNHLNAPLKIAGDGPERSRLESLAGDNIEFLGYIDERRKRELMAAAKAHVYNPENEDFGMVPIESMAAGTPVIGVNEGFTRYQILNGENGYTYERGEQHLYDAVQRFEREGVAWTPEEIAGFAENWFGVEQFEVGMQAAIEDAQAKSEVTTPWQTADGAPGTRVLTADGGDIDGGD